MLVNERERDRERVNKVNNYIRIYIFNVKLFRVLKKKVIDEDRLFLYY